MDLPVTPSVVPAASAMPAPLPQQVPPPKRRSIFYIDGFNFYYGLLRDRPDLKWLNYRRLASLLHPDDEIVAVRFYTAEIDRNNPQSPAKHRQNKLWQALQTEPKLSITYGKFSWRDRRCGVRACTMPVADRTYSALEEKQTDVNLAVGLIRDVINLKPDTIVIMSGDSDLLPILDLALELDKKVRPAFYVPTTPDELKQRRKDEFGKYSRAINLISEKYLRQAQFPNVVTLANGSTVTRPPEWV